MKQQRIDAEPGWNLLMTPLKHWLGRILAPFLVKALIRSGATRPDSNPTSRRIWRIIRWLELEVNRGSDHDRPRRGR